MTDTIGGFLLRPECPILCRKGWNPSILCRFCFDEWLGTVVGTPENDFSNNIIIYPNPAKDEIRVKADKDYNITIFNNLGNIMKEIKPQETSSKSMVISLSALKPGLYFINFYNEAEFFSRKLIIMR
jgi:hypothetical protein